MSSNDFDDLAAQARHIAKLLATIFEDVTGEEFALDSAVRHYPVVALGLALGAGALGGWWVGRKTRPQLPPPAPTSQSETLYDSIRTFAARLRRRESGAGEQEPLHPLDYLEQLLPGGVDRVREALPDLTAEEAGAVAKDWLDTVLEPKLREGLDTVVSNVSESRFGAFLRQQMQRLEDDNGSEPPGDAPGR